MIQDNKVAEVREQTTPYFLRDEISHSDLIFLHRFLMGIPQMQDAPYLSFGTALHRAILEPHLYHDEDFPDIDHVRLHQLKEAFFSRPFLESIYHESRKEEIRIALHASGIPIRAKYDLVSPSLITDLKTTCARTPTTFINSFYRFKYHSQMAFYMDLFQQDTAMIIAMSKANGKLFPFTYRRNDPCICKGRNYYQRLLHIMGRNKHFQCLVVAERKKRFLSQNT